MQDRDLLLDAAHRLRAFHTYLCQQRHRMVLWCDQDGMPIHSLLPLVLDVWPSPHVALGAGDDLQSWLSGVQQREMTQARSLLGQEASLVVVDARAGIDPDALGAISGILTAGGLLVLVTAATTFAGRFGQRLYRMLSEREAVVRALPERPFDTAVDVAPVQQGPTPEQQAVVDRVLQLPAYSPLVVTALRGRGKSASLGMAAAALLARGEKEIWVSAPRAVAVTPLFAHLQAACPRGRREGNRFHTASGCVRFVAPDAIAHQYADHPTPPVLLVDEAAALPVSYVQQWLVHFPRLVLATTLQGYEGNGQGFAHAVARHLAHAPLHLKTPIRWADDDPLECWVAETLCLGVTPPVPKASLVNIAIEPLDRDQWVTDEALLTAVFGLLTHAHYRTTPRDVMTLLDHPCVCLWGAWSDGALVGVVACFDEGGLVAELAEQVAAGARRTQGHLLAQTLALHTGMPSVAQAQWRRITRIAVHPDVHRQGLGTRLVDAIEADAKARGIALAGASFGGTPALIAFWQALGYQPVRVGLKADKVTGERAVIMAKNIADSSHVNVKQLRQCFLSQLPGLAAFELNALPPEVLAALLTNAASYIPLLDNDELAWLRRVGLAHAPIASARAVLQQAFLHVIDTLEPPSRAGLAGVLFQGRDMAWLATQQQLSGRRSAEQWLRQHIAGWIAWLER